MREFLTIPLQSRARDYGFFQGLQEQFFAVVWARYLFQVLFLFQTANQLGDGRLGDGQLIRDEGYRDAIVMDDAINDFYFRLGEQVFRTIFSRTLAFPNHSIGYSGKVILCQLIQLGKGGLFRHGQDTGE